MDDAGTILCGRRYYAAENFRDMLGLSKHRITQEELSHFGKDDDNLYAESWYKYGIRKDERTFWHTINMHREAQQKSLSIEVEMIRFLEDKKRSG